MMKKTIYGLLVGLLTLTTTMTRADEGMWIPMLLEQLNQKDMQDMGMRITAKEIYDINNSSMKDAILLFGGGCTASIISDEGLILTNHHCGYRQIQKHSTIEHDYLTDGFWAMNRDEELSNPGLTVTRLVRMEDITEQMLAGIEGDMTEKIRDSIIKENEKEIKKAATEGTDYNARVRPFYYGNEYYLFITEKFKDIRLVGAPPSNIGKFGGDTDNWMWPRHTGDFSLFRIYVNKENQPAEFSEENVPYKPLYTLPISIKGVQEDDFTFIFGFPGRTQEYLPSDAIEMITEVQNPAQIKLRRQKLDIFESFMNSDPKVRIQYSAKHAGLSNGWKKWIGENKGIMKLNGIEQKKDYEDQFTQWVNSSGERKKKYAGLLGAFDETYATYADYQSQFSYWMEAGYRLEIVRAARMVNQLVDKSKNKETTREELDKTLEKTKSDLESFYDDYYLPIDKRVVQTMLESYRQNVEEAYLPPVFALIDKKFKGSIPRYVDYLFEKSMFASKEKTIAFLDSYKKSKYKKIEKDPAFILSKEIMDHYLKNIRPEIAFVGNNIDSLMRIYMKAQMEMKPDKVFYPDANSTLRVSYGKVKPYYPRDGVFYDYQTTLTGIIEKEDPNIYDYVVEDKLKQLYADRDFGNYGIDGQMPVCFIATNHTTGGNSGSPAFNADGELIGLNFDRCWEGTMSDLMFNPDQCRNIMLDVRYFLFLVDKFAGASHLVDEMVIID